MFSCATSEVIRSSGEFSVSLCHMLYEPNQKISDQISQLIRGYFTELDVAQVERCLVVTIGTFLTILRVFQPVFFTKN
jgi:hypothetical protein